MAEAEEVKDETFQLPQDGTFNCMWQHIHCKKKPHQKPPKENTLTKNYTVALLCSNYLFSSSARAQSLVVSRLGSEVLK